jgi:hypothetical protein
MVKRPGRVHQLLTGRRELCLGEFGGQVFHGDAKDLFERI